MSFSDYVEGQQTSDGGYVVAGTTYNYPLGYQVYLVKTDASGNALWTRAYGGTGNEGGYSVQQTSDGGYIITGYTDTATPGTRHVYLVRTNASGDTLWTGTYGGTSNDYGYSVRQTSDSGCITAGLTQSFGNGMQAYLARTTASGNLVWQKAYGGAAQDQAYSVQQTSDSGYIVAGMTYDSSMSYQAWLIKTDASGDTLWTRTYGGTSTDYAQSVQQTSDDGYIVAGYTNRYSSYFQVYLVKTDASGGLLWERGYGYPGYDYDFGMSVRQTSDSGYIIAGYTDNYGSGDKVYLIKTDADGNTGIEEKSGPGPTVKGQRVIVTPNPFSSSARIPGHEAERFDLYDISGKWVEVCRGDRFGERLSPGVYFISPEESHSRSVRFVKVK
jgi:hypothetical protein